MKFPRHEADLILTHNDHKSNSYDTVQSAINDGDYGYRKNDWVSEEQKQKAIKTNDCWRLQWYPNKPIGYNVLSAADLDVLLEAASQTENADAS